MNGLSKLGIVLIVVFPLLIAALLAELFYVLYRRRKFQLRNRIEDDSEFPTDPSSFLDNPSKELLYFFCWKAQNPVDPNDSHPTRVQQLDAPSADVAVDAAAAATGVLSWQGLYGPSRVLFTIKEEEREDAAAAVERESEVVVKVVGGGVDVDVDVDVVEATPFCTPCASPFYYTPTASPAREVPENDVAEEVSDFGERTAPFVSLEVHGE